MSKMDVNKKNMQKKEIKPIISALKFTQEKKKGRIHSMTPGGGNYCNDIC